MKLRKTLSDEDWFNLNHPCNTILVYGTNERHYWNKYHQYFNKISGIDCFYKCATESNMNVESRWQRSSHFIFLLALNIFNFQLYSQPYPFRVLQKCCKFWRQNFYKNISNSYINILLLVFSRIFRCPSRFLSSWCICPA